MKNNFLTKVRVEALEDRLLLAGDVAVFHDFNDTLYIDQGDWGATDIRTGGGTDQITIFDVSFLATLDIRAGGGNDTLQITNIFVDGDTNLRGNSGNDDFTITFGDFGGDFNVFLGSADDQLTVSNNTVGENALWNGGNGIDTLIDNGGNVIGGTLTIRRFEN